MGMHLQLLHCSSQMIVGCTVVELGFANWLTMEYNVLERDTDSCNNCRVYIVSATALEDGGKHLQEAEHKLYSCA